MVFSINIVINVNNIDHINNIDIDIGQYYMVNIVSEYLKIRYDIADIYENQSIFETMSKTFKHSPSLQMVLPTMQPYFLIECGY